MAYKIEIPMNASIVKIVDIFKQEIEALHDRIDDLDKPSPSIPVGTETVARPQVSQNVDIKAYEARLKKQLNNLKRTGGINGKGKNDRKGKSERTAD